MTIQKYHTATVNFSRSVRVRTLQEVEEIGMVLEIVEKLVQILDSYSYRALKIEQMEWQEIFEELTEHSSHDYFNRFR